ncbi:hypothetical protein Tco_0481989 [Tanacetum coccineum]
MVVQNQSELGEGLANPTDPHHTPTIIQSSTQPQKTQKPRKPKRKDTQVSQPSGPTEKLLHIGNTLQSDEDRLKLDELMALCTTLQNRVLDLEKTKTTQQNEIASLKRRVKKLEKKIDVAQVRTAATTVTITTEEITLAQALEALKTSKPKVKGIVFQELAVEGKKRVGAELVQESTKKQNVEDDKEIAEIKQLMKIIPDEEEVAIDVIPLAVKSLKV